MLLFFLLFLLPPFLAAVYATVAAVFNHLWGETPAFWKHYYWRPLLWRWLLFFFLLLLICCCCVVVVVTRKGTTTTFDELLPTAVAAALVVLSVGVSSVAVRQTRIWTVVGGHPPALFLVNTEDSSSHHNQKDSKQSKQHQQQQRKSNNKKQRRNRVYVITGANTGIGKETARALLQCQSHHCTVVLCCRSLAKAQAAADELVKLSQLLPKSNNNKHHNHNNNTVTCVELDLSDYQSVRRAAATVRQQFDVVDCLINNAGLMRAAPPVYITVPPPVTKNNNSSSSSSGSSSSSNSSSSSSSTAAAAKKAPEEQHELVMATNHLGHYLWTRLLLPCLQGSDDARILQLTSSTYTLAVPSSSSLDNHKQQEQQQQILPLDDMFCLHRRSYSLFGQYAVSKLANIYMMLELPKRNNKNKHKNNNNNKNKNNNRILCAAIHPGLVRTDVTRYMPWYLRYPNRWLGALVATLQKTPAQGAWCTLHVATAAREELLKEKEDDDDDSTSSSACSSSLYWVNQKPQALAQPLLDHWDLVEKEAAALWDWSAQMVGLNDNHTTTNSNDDDDDSKENSTPTTGSSPLPKSK